MDWVRDFYSTTGRWWAPAMAGIGQRERRRAALVDRVCGAGPYRVLELGAGFGNTAAALAEHGHDVTAVEISDRAEQAQRYVGPRLQVVQEDFYAVELPGGYDAVCYFNGFGIGTDTDQRRLLRRIATEWLRPGGSALIDVMNPFVWARWAGDREHQDADPANGYAYTVDERTDFDPVRSRYTDTWWETDRPDEAITQVGRCYSPADLVLLLETTGLRLDQLWVDGEPLELTADHAGNATLLHRAHEYLAVLRHAGSATSR
ncbi:class I SAM-dependent methyltransferase [Actinocatenispora sera]|uniref:Methyltransferase n=1 Tax=Actinocatenispora sera TaxID=390989 RepID=A0A810L5N6_9ACTN|nr:class I SAM-dependent methyltransferase [Actinocatenispora sera]BCJ30215.1 methyltransferase [Actinocatenispora sera]